MALVQGKQPSIRFDVAGPFGFQGKSFVPKVVTFKKDAIAGTSNNDFWQVPAGTFIQQVGIRLDAALDGSGTVSLGTDADPIAFIAVTDFDTTTVGNWATNIGSTNCTNGNGLYFPAADLIRLAVGGTPTVGAVSGFVSYFEVGAMVDEGLHFDIA